MQTHTRTHLPTMSYLCSQSWLAYSRSQVKLPQHANIFCIMFCDSYFTNVKLYHGDSPHWPALKSRRGYDCGRWKYVNMGVGIFKTKRLYLQKTTGRQMVMMFSAIRILKTQISVFFYFEASIWDKMVDAGLVMHCNWSGDTIQYVSQCWKCDPTFVVTYLSESHPGRMCWGLQLPFK